MPLRSPPEAKTRPPGAPLPIVRLTRREASLDRGAVDGSKVALERLVYPAEPIIPCVAMCEPPLCVYTGDTKPILSKVAAGDDLNVVLNPPTQSEVLGLLLEAEVPCEVPGVLAWSGEEPAGAEEPRARSIVISPDDLKLLSSINHHKYSAWKKTETRKSLRLVLKGKSVAAAGHQT